MRNSGHTPRARAAWRVSNMMHVSGHKQQGRRVRNGCRPLPLTNSSLAAIAEQSIIYWPIHEQRINGTLSEVMI